jgi:hypothetical protein
MAAVIGSIKEDGSDWGGADVSGREEEREELVGDSTRLHGCPRLQASLAASVARPGEKMESERVPKQRMTMKPLGREWRRGRAGRLAGRWPIPNEKILHQKPCPDSRGGRWAVVIGCPRA